MRVLLTSWGSRGDIEPLAGLAVAIQRRGGEAVIAAPPDDDFAVLLERAGVPMIGLGPSVKSVVAAPKPPGAQAAFQLAPALVAARFETLMTAGRGCDALLATGLMPAGARDVADKLGIRYVLACFHTLGLPSRTEAPGRRPGTPSLPGADLKTQWAQDAERVNALYGAAVNTHRAAIGLPPIDNVRDYVFGDRPWLAADPVLWPAAGTTEFDLVQTGAWFLPDDRPLPAGLESFLDAGEPPVYVGFGSMASYTSKDLAQVSIGSVRAQGRRIVLASGWAGLTGIDDAPDCFVVGDVNQQALFPRMAAIVHHGGAGTTHTAARSGTPQVIVPHIADQPRWAARIAELGIGVAHDGSAPAVDSLSAALTAAMKPDLRVRAQAVAATITADGADAAAKLLLNP
ncbi:glycosyltransferase [Actinoplanes sp. L3-i22]|uniref:glycosyltransferase n=1 Tax=Actinoplanes sp. L3-i22 TaxID=2836373 RepID=UPI001C7493CD|nr:glycosyltransferase [Actinoplanes sp. L3-i22]BCY08411.1 glycosyl transferase [Actinoplanes sp. L3-i22]